MTTSYPTTTPSARGFLDAEARSEKVWLAGSIESVARPALRRRDYLTGAVGRAAATAATTMGGGFSVVLACPSHHVLTAAAAVSMFAGIGATLYAGVSALAELTSEANDRWASYRAESQRALRNAKGTPERRGLKYSLARTGAEILELLETATNEELFIRRHLGVKSGPLTVHSGYQRNPYRHLQGELLTEVLEADARRLQALAEAEVALAAVRDLADAIENAAVARARYERTHGRGAPIRAVDTTAVTQYAELFHSDATAIAALAH